MARATTTRKWVDFELQAQPGAKVFLAGTFNDWDAAQVRMHDRSKDGFYRTSLLLPKGKHEYKFVVNGVWCADPKCQEWAPNNCGTLNSIIMVG
jgi:1,4-alpha-glucan branching enzyme